MIRTLYEYTCAALIGSVTFGLLFGWTEHREMASIIGAILAMLGWFWLNRRYDETSE